MTIQTTSTMIYIGNQPIIDVDEGDSFYENSAALSATYTDLEMVDITNFDVSEDGVIWSDEVGTGDYIEYTIDGVTYSGPQDAIILYNAVITERDGTVHNVEVSVIQAPNGDTFINDKGNDGATDNLNIKTIELTTPTETSSFSGRNTFASTQNTAVCFGSGSLISTPTGPRQVQSLRKGDAICTWHGAPTRIEWIGVRHICRPGRQSPVRIPAAALGPGFPAQDLHLSPQHRVVIRSPIVERMFGVQQVFVSAKTLLKLPGVRQLPDRQPVQYWHILCDMHQVILANGLPVETLFPGPVARANLPGQARAEITRITNLHGAAFDMPCLDVPPGRLQRKLIQRHVLNNKPCIAPDQLPARQANSLAWPEAPGGATVTARTAAGARLIPEPAYMSPRPQEYL